MTITRLVHCIVDFIVALRRHHRDHQLLVKLSDRELRDIGVNRCAIDAEEEGVEPWRWGSHP